MVKYIRLNPRLSKRVSITICHNVYEKLASRSDEEGRSFSNLCAFLLEEAIDAIETSRSKESSSDGNIRNL